MNQDNKELVEQITKYFKKRYNHTLSEEEAMECLDNLADLFLAFAKIEKRKSSISDSFIVK